MKQNLLKTMLFSTALVVGTMGGRADNGNGIITTLPVTEDFENGTGVFSGGENSSSTNVSKVLNVCNTTATASFDSDAEAEGNQAYALKSNEKVTIAYKAFHGYYNDGKGHNQNVISVNNSKGESLLKYTYDSKVCQITDVSIGGKTVSGFSAFGCQTQFSGTSGANGLVGNGRPYAANEENTPKITIELSGNGFVSISIVGKLVTNKTLVDVNQAYSASLDANVAKDIASITITSNVNNSDRGYAIDNLSITSEMTKDVTASYTIKKMCGKVELEAETAAGIVGSTPTLPTSNIFVGEKKYVYVDNDAETIGNIAAEGTVYTLNYREAEKYNYAVTGNFDGETLKEITSGAIYEGEAVKIAYNRYILKDGILYEAAANNKEYNNSFIINENNQKFGIEYKTTDKKNVVFFKEAEDIDGLTAVESGNANIRCSASKGAYAPSDVVIATLPAGSYKVVAAVFGNASSTSIFSMKAGENTVFEAATKGYLDEQTSIEFKLPTQSDIVLATGGSGGNSPKLLDYIIIEKTAEAVPVTNIGYATYVPTCNVVAPSDVKVYTAKVNEAKSAVVLSEVAAGSVIPAGTPVLVGAAQGTYSFTASADEASTLGQNDLLAVNGTKGDGKTIYALVNKNGQPVFALMKEGVELTPGTAYLKLDDTSAAYYSIAFGCGETTGINEINAANAKVNDSYYTLQGVKTSKPAKGLYIHNGKKVVIK